MFCKNAKKIDEFLMTMNWVSGISIDFFINASMHK